ncbi:MAG: DUF389 domain-containing protein, partial [Pseudomonadota bacterium]|nr:DUF389 domain-containing protein [Pseudomonadota bacterium]
AEAARADAAVADRLALAAGVTADAVTLDSSHHRATVRAAPLPGATMGTYRALEGRVAAASPGWDVRLIPPIAPVAPVSFANGAPDDAGQAAIADAVWGAGRLQLAVTVAGSGKVADQVAATLGTAGATVVRVRGSRRAPIALGWQVISTGGGA